MLKSSKKEFCPTIVNSLKRLPIASILAFASGLNNFSLLKIIFWIISYLGLLQNSLIISKIVSSWQAILGIILLKYHNVRYNNIMLWFLLRYFQNILFVKEFTLHVNARELFVMLEINLGLSSETSRENFT